MGHDASNIELAYIEFKTAQALYHKRFAVLEADERNEVRRVAARQRAIQSRVLAAREASGVCVPPATLDSAMTEIRQRYADETEFVSDLGSNGLDRPGLEAALRRGLAVEAVLARVSSEMPPVSDTDAELYYRLHIERFLWRECRRVSHILITINEQFDENRREAALTRIEAIARRVARARERFAEQAAQHSECPSALHGGILGEIHRGQLFPALEGALFALRAGELSGIVESPLGFHILRCDAVLPAGVMPFEDALPRIRATLHERRARTVQRDWLRGLLAEGNTEARRKPVSGPD